MKKFENFKKALTNLELCRDYEPPYDVVTETGLVNLFVICFEQSWKAMKEILEKHGYDKGKTGSPRMIIKLAYSAGMIKNEEKWLGLLEHRNLASHTYDEGVAEEIIAETKRCYLDLFRQLEMELTENWLS